MPKAAKLPFFVSIPHSGEQVPPEVTWLKTLPETTLMRDVDRYVDRLYEPALKEWEIPHLISPWHRYVVDLNRKPHEYDQRAVRKAPQAQGTHPRGLHWSVTTFNETLIPEPMAKELHESLVEKYYKPFHQWVVETRENLKSQFGVAYQLDLHSMPSQGTALHPDPGESRAQVVISDYEGTSARADFKDLVMEAFKGAGFQLAYNWPYVGGGITKMYGEPEKSFHTIQVELNRNLYMDEETKAMDPVLFPQVQDQLKKALGTVHSGIKEGFNGTPS